MSGLGESVVKQLHKRELYIDLDLRKFSQFEENQFGADIGIVLKTQTSEHSVEKAILLQAKRLKPDNSGYFSPTSKYDELIEKRGLDQAKKMLSITPASFFILYNPPIPSSRVIMNFVINTDTSRMTNIAESDITPVYLSGCDDITILPALTRVGWRREGTINKIHKFTSPFSSFMVDDFFQGKVGDSSSTTKKVAYGEDENNPIRYSLRINIGEAD
jgi:hypothetical protein